MLFREINRRGNNRLYYEKGNFKRHFGNSAYIKHFWTICKCRNYPSVQGICAKVKVCSSSYEISLLVASFSLQCLWKPLHLSWGCQCGQFTRHPRTSLLCLINDRVLDELTVSSMFLFLGKCPTVFWFYWTQDKRSLGVWTMLSPWSGCWKEHPMGSSINLVPLTTRRIPTTTLWELCRESNYLLIWETWQASFPLLTHSSQACNRLPTLLQRKSRNLSHVWSSARSKNLPVTCLG